MQTTTLQDGVYRWRAVQAYGPGQNMEATVTGGRVTGWAYVSHDETEVFPFTAEQVAQHEAAFRAQLAHEVSEAQRLAGLVHPVNFTPAPVATIGKARAHKLHKLMGRAGLMEHYGFARRALGKEVYSLAALTEEEARKVWQFVQHMTGPVQHAV